MNMEENNGIACPEKKEIPGQRLFVSQEFLAEMSREILAHRDRETGGYIYGLRIPLAHTRILAAIGSFTPKNRQEIVRTHGHLDMGGEDCGEHHDWQQIHWEYTFRKFLGKFGLPVDTLKKVRIEVLGMWHKHPGHFIRYSQTDDRAVNEHLDRSFDDFLFPIAILRQKLFGGRLFRQAPPAEVLRLSVSDTTELEVKFWYRSNNRRAATVALPAIVERSDHFPSLTPAPWTIDRPDLFACECGLLGELGYRVALMPFIPKGKTHAQVWLELKHGDSQRLVYVRTSLDYPVTRAVFVSFVDPVKEPDQEIGMIVPPTAKGMAEVIEPMLSYYRGVGKGTL